MKEVKIIKKTLNRKINFIKFSKKEVILILWIIVWIAIKLELIRVIKCKVKIKRMKEIKVILCLQTIKIIIFRLI
jgi:IS4 transposase